MIKRKSTLHVAVAIGALVVTWNVSMSTFGEQLGSSAGRLYWANVNVTRIPESLDLLAMGKMTYGQRCAGCHGQNGLGNGPAAAYLLTKPRNFSEAEFKLRTTMDFPTDEDLFRTITVGFPAYGMPKFAYLPEELRWGLVYYVKQLGRNSFERLVANMLAHEAFGADLDTLTSEQKAESAKKSRKYWGQASRLPHSNLNRRRGSNCLKRRRLQRPIRLGAKRSTSNWDATNATAMPAMATAHRHKN